LVKRGGKFLQTISHENTFKNEIHKIWHRLPSKFRFHKTNLPFVFKNPGKSSGKTILFNVGKYGFLKKMRSGRRAAGLWTRVTTFEWSAPGEGSLIFKELCQRASAIFTSHPYD